MLPVEQALAPGTSEWSSALVLAMHCQLRGIWSQRHGPPALRGGTSASIPVLRVASPQPLPLAVCFIFCHRPCALRHNAVSCGDNATWRQSRVHKAPTELKVGRGGCWALKTMPGLSGIWGTRETVPAGRGGLGKQSPQKPLRRRAPSLRGELRVQVSEEARGRNCTTDLRRHDKNRKAKHR